MDWSKAKNILIIAFIITNMILGLVLINKNNDINTSNEEFVNDVKNKLNEKGITIETDIPSKTPSQPMLTIEYEVYNLEEIANYLFDDYITRDIHGNLEYVSDNKILTTNNNDKKLIYENPNNEIIYSDLNEEKIEKIAKEFIENINLDTKDYRLGHYFVNNEGYNVGYIKVYGDKFVEETYMNFVIDNRGVKNFERFWVHSKGLNEKKMDVKEASSALLKLLSDSENYNKIITDISLCYYFDNSSVNLKDTIKGQGEPAWRVKFNDGSVKILN